MNTQTQGLTDRPLAIERAVLVYQAGIANVFAVNSFNLADYGRDAKRLMQADFRTCEAYARGLRDAGVTIGTLACNAAGDIAHLKWSDDLSAQPFSDGFRPVYSPGVQRTDNIEPTNANRADWAAAAVHTFADATNQREKGQYTDDLHSIVSDLLADLMHYCRREGVDFDETLETARAHFNFEREEERPDPNA